MFTCVSECPICSDGKECVVREDGDTVCACPAGTVPNMMGTCSKCPGKMDKPPLECNNSVVRALTHLLSCQPRVKVSSCIVYKVIRDL